MHTFLKFKIKEKLAQGHNQLTEEETQAACHQPTLLKHYAIYCQRSPKNNPGSKLQGQGICMGISLFSIILVSGNWKHLDCDGDGPVHSLLSPILTLLSCSFTGFTVSVHLLSVIIREVAISPLFCSSKVVLLGQWLSSLSLESHERLKKCCLRSPPPRDSDLIGCSVRNFLKTSQVLLICNLG